MRARTALNLTRRAARLRWPVSLPARQEALALARRVMADDDAPARDRIAAAKLLIEADRLNLTEDALALKASESAPPPPPAPVNVNVVTILPGDVAAARQLLAAADAGRVADGDLPADGGQEPLGP